MEILDKPFEILLVEDNIGDVELIKELFEDAKIRINLHVQKTEKKQSVFYTIRTSF